MFGQLLLLQSNRVLFAIYCGLVAYSWMLDRELVDLTFGRVAILWILLGLVAVCGRIIHLQCRCTTKTKFSSVYSIPLEQVKRVPACLAGVAFACV